MGRIPITESSNNSVKNSLDKLQSIRAAAGPAQTLGLSDSVIKQFLAQFEKLSREFPGAIDQVVGTGLMVSAMLNPKR